MIDGDAEMGLPVNELVAGQRVDVLSVLLRPVVAASAIVEALELADQLGPRCETHIDAVKVGLAEPRIDVIVHVAQVD